mmetsp:Transcript_54997/g.110427  ORF Transcript_54997/g.110427 Transcript_54997/m.110427 type:complete len:111 (-) Transcript_54997:47-379(-)
MHGGRVGLLRTEVGKGGCCHVDGGFCQCLRPGRSHTSPVAALAGARPACSLRRHLRRLAACIRLGYASARASCELPQRPVPARCRQMGMLCAAGALLQLVARCRGAAVSG